MAIKTITYNEDLYPYFQTQGNAAQFAIPYAKHFCTGYGYDIGCKKIEGSFPGSIPIDISFDDNYNANNLPKKYKNIFVSGVDLNNSYIVGEK